jgi:hypothetical protein
MAMTKPTSDQITFLNTVTLPGDLAVNGADITTTATGTATVFNTNATTLNVGGAATTLSLGAATGTASVNNATFRFNSGYGSVATAYGCRAWVNFNGTGTVAIRASGNVSSITDNGTGDYTVNFTTAMPDANYAVVGFAETTQDYPIRYGGMTVQSGQTDMTVRVTTSFGSSSANSGAASDSAVCNVAIFR